MIFVIDRRVVITFLLFKDRANNERKYSAPHSYSVAHRIIHYRYKQKFANKFTKKQLRHKVVKKLLQNYTQVTVCMIML